MPDANEFADLIGSYFGVADAPHLSLCPLGKGRFSATLLDIPLQSGETRLVKIPPAKAYLLTLYMADTEHCDIGPKGDIGQRRLYRQGSVCLVNLSQGASVQLSRSLNAISLYFPCSLFQEIADAFGVEKPGKLRCLRGIPDRTIYNIGRALASELKGEGQFNNAMIVHVALAVGGYLVHMYQERPLMLGVEPFDPFQEKALHEYLADHFGETVTMEDLVTYLGVLPEGFAEKLEQTVGKPFDQWLLAFRLDQAKDLLRYSETPLEEVIRRCGLPDHPSVRRVLADVIDIPTPDILH